MLAYRVRDMVHTATTGVTYIQDDKGVSSPFKCMELVRTNMRVRIDVLYLRCSAYFTLMMSSGSCTGSFGRPHGPIIRRSSEEGTP